jgi:isopenicillin N synthase-like dioxygenase
VPLIDIGASFSADSAARETIAQQIREACVTTGFFQISNHGVSAEAMAGVLKQAERFFHELSPTEKEELHVKHSPLFRGYEPHDFSYVNPDDMGKDGSGYEHQQETKEGFNWGYEAGLDPTGGDGKYVELDGQSPAATGLGNLWPREDSLPGFYDAIRLYYGQVLQLARHLFRLFALSLGLEEGYFDQAMTHPGGIARLLYYKSQPSATNGAAAAAAAGRGDGESEGKLGLGAHTDYECFTLLLSSSNPGLEILFPPSPLTDNKPVWLPCPVRPGTLTVNVADFLMRWTNGLYKSTIHRVVTKPGSGERYSVPFFFSINYDADVEALPEQVVGKSIYRPMKAGEYVLERLRATTM